MPNLPLGKTTVSYSGAAVIYDVTADGRVVTKLWGAGGGGTAFPGVGLAGAGGALTVQIYVANGDQIKVEVGQGGQPGVLDNPGAAQGTYTGNGGLGGWPDGGNGGVDVNAAAGGGGGSTRIYKNNVLVAVAGAGGGAGAGLSPATNGGRQSGAGGGLTGEGGTNIDNPGTTTGGSQVAGGVNSSQAGSSAPNFTGASLQGGHGYPAGSSNTTDHASASPVGPGGGGGYFGGAGAGKGGSYFPGSGGGSSYIASGYKGETFAGTRTTIGNTSDADRPSGAGAAGTNTLTTAQAGGDGAAVVEFIADATPGVLPLGKTTLGFINGAVVYDIDQDGRIYVKMWGGAGGATQLGGGITSSSPGGGGGFTFVALDVVDGDVIKCEVGQGGQIGVVASGTTGGSNMTGSGGLGGWPDGGNGSSGINTMSGGGGGSTRLYKNGTLVAVAGAGGGASANATNRPAGAGGGLVGQTSPQFIDTTGGHITGGTQTSGGVNGAFSGSAAPYYTGAAFQGGHGYPAGTTYQTDGRNDIGGGGGGGYYGGGGGGKTGGYYSAASGGSSYIASGTPGHTQQGSRGAPGGLNDPDRPSAAAVGGGFLVGSVPSAGGDGAVVLNFTPASTPKLIEPHTGAAKTFTALHTGVMRAKLWGAGGGGGGGAGANNVPVNFKTAGPGGYVEGLFNVVAGDSIELRVGGGGPARQLFAANAGAGGYPDGGNGGAPTSSGFMGGGGGGSTRLYINGTLVAIAGAGGGSAATGAGAGGGLTAQSSDTGIAPIITGGSQFAGGVDPNGGGAGASLQGANSATGTAGSCGGGGGGYFGGGSMGATSAASVQARAAGGGSSFLHTSSLRGSQNVAGASNFAPTVGVESFPPRTSDPDYIAGVGTGGVSWQHPTNTSGGMGLAVLSFEQALGKSSNDYTGAGVKRIIPRTGKIKVKLWGGGGGGSTYTGSAPGVVDSARGAAGGYTTFDLAVVAGDEIEVQVGQGGRTIGSGGGPGGWPDGGSGGNNLGFYARGGGGGGSTRLYKNGVLVGIAGAGGGGGGSGGASPTVELANLGVGGGANAGGHTSVQIHETARTITGATQSAGGVNSGSGVTQNGAFLQGANGYQPGFSTVRTDTASNYSGGGGGGGYYGGAGGGTVNNNSAIGSPGSGGSGWYAATGDVTNGVTTNGTNATPPNSGDADYVAGRGVGGAGGAGGGVGVHGGDGLAVLDYSVPLAANTVTTESASGSPVVYEAQADGLLNIEAWGGGGAGGVYFSGGTASRPGGAGGFMQLKIPVVVGDRIKLEVATGGETPLGASNNAGPTAGGRGGWPDGGWGGRSSSNVNTGFGGGGGSTRVYKNDVLIGVAGGGGGATGFYRGGPGGGVQGGLAGETGDSTAPNRLSGGSGTGSTNINNGLGQKISGLSQTGANGWSGAADNNTADAGASAAGGGGYYGGGAGNVDGAHAPSSGGAGYLALDFGGGLLVNGTQGTPAAGILSTRPSDVALGGLNSTALLSTVLPGGPGYVWMRLDSESAIVAPPRTLLSTWTGYKRRFNIDRTGDVIAKLWGGGGAGGTYWASTRTTRKGGAGGHVEVTIPVVNGDYIEVEVGQGGGKPYVFSGTGGQGAALMPGFGGWPDGGLSGRHAGPDAGGFGGGGGSTRVYKNGTLVAIAPGGGGCTGFYFGGNGGGLTGGASADDASCGTGGTQSAGGTSDGASMQGAPGWVGNPENTETTAGAGGGGGYYGGGSNAGRGAGANGSGGGGSAYIAPGYTGLTVMGTIDTGTPYNGVDGDRPVGAAVGGSTSTAGTTAGVLASMTAGGDGAALIDFPLPVTDGVPVTVPYTGQAQTYIVDADGVLAVEMWGGGGGGGSRNDGAAADGKGGGGGNLTGSINVFKGDVLTVEVGQGGRRGVSLTNGGLGGWPDGGNGGLGTNIGLSAGGGGGSTRLYRNNVLLAVAAGGAGVISNGQGGIGGGLTGGTGSGTNAGTGGSQIAPGIAQNTTAVTSAALRGGSGYRTGFTNLTPDDHAGGGGGGGWFGGAGGCPAGGNPRAYPSGGGGSSWALPAGVPFTNTSATLNVAFDSGHKPVGVGQGGLGANNGTQTNGGDGAIYFSLTAAPIQDAIVFEHTGADQTWTSPTFGVLHVQAYGAGGATGAGGGLNNGGSAGGGGYVDFQVPVSASDVIKIQVGGRGEIGSAAAGGNGGWPDGGDGGRFVSGGFWGGGGGGSTRIYKNNVLIAVAAGGGGNTGAGQGGAAGGLTGGNGSGSGAGSGGTQSAGGNSSNPTTFTPGGSLTGGHGYATSQTTQDERSGAGGGGGYYGGGGSYAPGDRGIPSAGGGSSFLTIGLIDDSITGATAEAPPASDILIPGVGYGGKPPSGLTGAASSYPGYHGLTVLHLDATGIVAAGDIGTVTMTAPEAGVDALLEEDMPGPVTMTAPEGGTVVGTPSGDISPPNVVMTPPEADAQAVVHVDALLDPVVVNMEMNLQGIPVSEAVVIQPLVEYDIEVSLTPSTPPEIVAGVDLVTFEEPLIIRMTPPRGSIPGEAVEEPESSEAKIVTMTAPEAFAEEGSQADGAALDPITMVLTDPVATATGAAVGDPIDLTGEPPYAFRTVFMSPPNGIPQSGDPTITVDPWPAIDMQMNLVGFAEDGIEVGAFIDQTVQMTAPLGFSTGAATYNVGPEFVNDDPNERWFKRIVMSAPQSPTDGTGVSAGQRFNVLPNSMDIIMAPPSASAFHAADVFAAILPARIVMKKPEGVGYTGNLALAIGDLEELVITMTPPDGTVPADSGEIGEPILVDYVDGYVDAPLPPGTAKIKLKRSLLRTVKPDTLAEREIGLNESDGVLYSRDGDGLVQASPYAGFGRGRVVPDGGTVGQVLGVDYVWKDPVPGGSRPSPIIPPVTPTRVVLGEGHLRFGDPVENTGYGFFKTPRVYYRPFFLPKRMTFLSLLVQQGQPNSAGETIFGFSVYLGVCSWNPNLAQPIDRMFSGSKHIADGGGFQLHQININQILEAGWYASMFAVRADSEGANPFILASWQGWGGSGWLGTDFHGIGTPYGDTDATHSIHTTPPPIVGYVRPGYGGYPTTAFVQALLADV